MLDIDYGTYPFVTSSPTGLGGAIDGLSLSPRNIKEVIGVVKAYTTRVGGGPFPSEQLNVCTPINPRCCPAMLILLQADGEKLQKLGREFGVTTGRKRRCGWLDLVVLKYSCAINHYTSLNLTKLDILDTFPTIKVAVAYKLDGKPLESFPADLSILERCEVVYEELPGWEASSAGAKAFTDLPANARKYVEFVEEFVGVKVKYIGTGVAREAMIVR